MNRSAPTEAETSALGKIAALRSRLFAIAMIGLGVTLWAIAIPSPMAQVVLVGSAVLVMTGSALYLSFGLRCPRCSSWIPPAATSKSRCTSCGMNLQTPGASSRQ
jgi:uncharacterized membrane protein